MIHTKNLNNFFTKKNSQELCYHQTAAAAVDNFYSDLKGFVKEHPNLSTEEGKKLLNIGVVIGEAFMSYGRHYYHSYTISDLKDFSDKVSNFLQTLSDADEEKKDRIFLKIDDFIALNMKGFQEFFASVNALDISLQP